MAVENDGLQWENDINS